jgi:transglutaminase/protease-like cytokinesis protein 3
LYDGVALSQEVNYERIDKHVLNTPKWAEKSIQSLASYLIQPARNEKEKVRAIFRWITYNINYNVQDLLPAHYDRSNLNDVIESKIAVCDGYAGLFEALAQAAGIKIINISGYAKGFDYEAGQKFQGPPNHAWNAVEIDGRWYLLDATWGAGFANEYREYIRQFEEHYFLTPPEQLIYTHFPEDKKWQLLTTSVSLEEFERSVLLKPAFFRYGLKLKSHLNGYIKTNKEVQITIGVPHEIVLIAQIYQNGNRLNESYTFGQRRTPNEFIIYAVFPRSGEYILRIFAKQENDPGKYIWVLDYKVVAGSVKQVNPGFPEAYNAFSDNDVFLFKPLTKFLRAGQAHTFTLSAPDAEDVAVAVNGELVPLKKQGSLFKENIEIGRGKVEVYIRYREKSKYLGLLCYIGY